MSVRSSVDTPPPVAPDRYPRTWALLLVLVLSVGLSRWEFLRRHPTVLYTAPAITTPEVRWFLVLRMPALTSQYESGLDTMKTRYDQWLTTLTQAGYHFMPYSDIQDRMSRGLGVPDKSILMVFDPGLRKTYELISPILMRHRTPALWLSDGSAMTHGNREFVTYHTARKMIASGLWDVGYSDENGIYHVDSRTHGLLQLGNRDHEAWSAISGGLALNRGREHSELNRLNVISDWTATDLLTRVQAEVPIEEPMALTEGSVQNLVWGVSAPINGPLSKMNLKALPYKRGLVLDWFGTRGIADFQIDAQAKTLVGEFCLRLRWDEERGNGVSILISRDAWVVMELENFHVKHKWRYARRGMKPFPAFAAHINLSDNALSVALDGHPIVTMTLTTDTDADRGLLQLFLVDKFRGSARADDVQLTFSPQ